MGEFKSDKVSSTKSLLGVKVEERDLHYCLIIAHYYLVVTSGQPLFNCCKLRALCILTATLGAGAVTILILHGETEAWRTEGTAPGHTDKQD